ncbi:hypothetical protein KP509_22G043700 [Ceratopteris richardii]|uniref:Chromo domain-containing protein n=1 Tax=Ceratopteris richardii TaxID=49495 RepID=A0A8T2S5G1_CERRI|nr:hypothetical protein KP509_22G043700 [Ceratopteris richardii]
MLMYGFQPRAPYAVGLQNEKVQAAKDFLEGMNDMLRLAMDSIRRAQDRARAYADPRRRDINFEVEQVYLRVSSRSETMKMGPCPKLSPRYCGPFQILKRIGKMAYQLQLPENSQIHPVFHVSRLKKRLGESDNLIPNSDVVEPICVQSIPHELESILHTREKQTRSHLYKECLVKWKDSSEDSATWERVSTLQRWFPSFRLLSPKGILKGKNTGKQHEDMTMYTRYMGI